jgi:type I restriction enzyme S subunit
MQILKRTRKSAQANLFLGAIALLVVTIPPLTEQHRIVKKVNELLTLCDSLKANLDQAQTLQTQLADTLVKQATH